MRTLVLTLILLQVPSLSWAGKGFVSKKLTTNAQKANKAVFVRITPRYAGRFLKMTQAQMLNLAAAAGRAGMHAMAQALGGAGTFRAADYRLLIAGRFSQQNREEFEKTATAIRKSLHRAHAAADSTDADRRGKPEKADGSRRPASDRIVADEVQQSRELQTQLQRLRRIEGVRFRVFARGAGASSNELKTAWQLASK